MAMGQVYDLIFFQWVRFFIWAGSSLVDLTDIYGKPIATYLLTLLYVAIGLWAQQDDPNLALHLQIQSVCFAFPYSIQISIKYPIIFIYFIYLNKI